MPGPVVVAAQPVWAGRPTAPEIEVNPSTQLVKAAAFAAHKHRAQRRKVGDIPYVNHPLAVAHTLVEVGGIEDEAALAAAMLHDTLEDTATTHTELASEFGDVIAGIVAEVTDDKSLPKVDRKRQQIAHAPHLSPTARLVKLADKLDNLRELARQPPPSWSGERVRGYFCWAAAVVDAVGNVNAGLWQALQTVFATEIEVAGRRGPAVPVDARARAETLQAYYTLMARVTD